MFGLGRRTAAAAGYVPGAVTPARRVAAAGRVSLATTSSIARTPWGVDSQHLLPVMWDGLGTGWWSRDAAMSLPTISRSRDLICNTIGELPLTLWRVDNTQAPAVETQIPIPPWMERPDPDRTLQWMISWTADDLYFYEVAHWEVIERYAGGDVDYPKAFRRILPGDLHVSEDGSTSINGRPVAPANIIEFLSPSQGLLSIGYRTISIALQLDDSAERFASNEIPAGVLEEQDGGEDLGADELSAAARAFGQARLENTTAYTNKYVRYREINVNPSSMQLVEGRTYQALELARLGNVPAYLVGAPAGTGMTYLNTAQAKSDLIQFGAMPLLRCIEQTLSGPNVTPRGQRVYFDVNAWLRTPYAAGAEPVAEEPVA